MIFLEEAIQYLKQVLSLKGKEWKETKDEEALKDCLSVIEAINSLEKRVYGKIITSISFIV